MDWPMGKIARISMTCGNHAAGGRMDWIDLYAFARFDSLQQFAAADIITNCLRHRDHAARKLATDFRAGRRRQLHRPIELARLADRRRARDSGLDSARLRGVSGNARPPLGVRIFPDVAFAVPHPDALDLETIVPLAHPRPPTKN